MPRDAEPAPKKPRPLRCWKCHYDLTGLAADADCPECGANQPADEVFEDDPDRTDTVFQRVDTPPMWAAGSVAHVGKQTRPSAHDPVDPPTEEDLEAARRDAGRYAWYLRVFLVILALGLTGFLLIEVNLRNGLWNPGGVLLLGILTLMTWIVLIRSFSISPDRTNPD